MGKDTRDPAGKGKRRQDRNRTSASRLPHLDTGQQQAGAGQPPAGVQGARSRVRCSDRDSDQSLDLLPLCADDNTAGAHPDVDRTPQEPASGSTPSVSSRGGSVTKISGVDLSTRGHRRRGSSSGSTSVGPGEQHSSHQHSLKEDILLAHAGPLHRTDALLKAMSRTAEEQQGQGGQGAPSQRLSQEASSLWRACGSLAGSLAGSVHDTVRWRPNEERQAGRDHCEGPRVERLHHRKSRTDELGDSTRSRTKRPGVGSGSSIRARDSPFTGMAALQQVGIGMGLLSTDAKTLLEGKRARLSTVALAPWALSSEQPGAAGLGGTTSTSSAGVQTQPSPKNSCASARTGGRSSARSSTTQQQHEEAVCLSVSRGPSACRIHSQTCSQGSASRPTRLRPRSMLPPPQPPQPAPRKRAVAPAAPGVAPGATPASRAPCEHGLSPETAVPLAPLAGLAAWLWSVPESARAQLHDALHTVAQAALVREQQQQPVSQTEACTEKIQEEQALPNLDQLSQAVGQVLSNAMSQAVSQAVVLLGAHEQERKGYPAMSQTVSQAVVLLGAQEQEVKEYPAMSQAMSQAVALLGAHEQERKECPADEVLPKALEALLLTAERCPGMASLSPWSSKSIVNLENVILALTTPSLSAKRLHETRLESPSPPSSAPLSLVARDSSATLSDAPEPAPCSGPVKPQSLSPNHPAESVGRRASPPSLLVSRGSSGHSGRSSVDSGPSAPPAPCDLAALAPPAHAVGFLEERCPAWGMSGSLRPPCLPRSTAASSGQSVGRVSDLPPCLVQPPASTAGPSGAPSDLATGILSAEPSAAENSTMTDSTGDVSDASTVLSCLDGVLAVPVADESIAVVPKGPLGLVAAGQEQGLELVCESAGTSTGLVITEQVDSQDDVPLEALLDRLPSVGSAALVAMAAEAMTTALVDEDVDDSGSKGALAEGAGAALGREVDIEEHPPAITCESVDSEVYALACGRVAVLGYSPPPPTCPSLPGALEESVAFDVEKDVDPGATASIATAVPGHEVPVRLADEREAVEPPLQTHSSQNLEPCDVQSIAICTMLDHLNSLLDNFKERPENRRRIVLERELENRLMTLLDHTQPRVHVELAPTARKFACSVSYWMETYLLKAEDKMASRR